MPGEASRAIRLRVRMEGGEAAVGPGKADLLELIGSTGSIAAAARELGMSYRRAWGLVEVMNGAFSSPLVAKEPGGAHGGGAVLTPTGKKVLTLYRAAETAAFEAASRDLAGIRKLIRRPEA